MQQHVVAGSKPLNINNNFQEAKTRDYGAGDFAGPANHTHDVDLKEEHGNEDFQTLPNNSDSKGSLEALQKFSGLSVTPPFVLKLCSMLSTNEFTHLVSWGIQGDTVLVKDLNLFSASVLPKYFKHRNFTSFLRQLNMYGFYTLRQGENWREFKNELFTRGGSRDYDKIKRKAPQNHNQPAFYPEKLPQSLSSHSDDNKETRKRKKDHIKGKNSQSSTSRKALEAQNDLIRQLLLRCEASEERIERLEEELRLLKRLVQKDASTKSSSSKSSKVTQPQNAEMEENILSESDDAGIDFGTGFEVIPPALEARQRTLSDTFLSVGGVSSAFGTGMLNSNLNFEGFSNFMPSRLNNFRQSSFDDMSLSMFSSSRPTYPAVAVKQTKAAGKVDSKTKSSRKKKKTMRMEGQQQQQQQNNLE